MSNPVRAPLGLLAFSIVAASVHPVFARGGAGPPVSMMTENYCRETVYNRGITDVTMFEEEVKKCVANPVTYPTSYAKPGRSWR